MNQKFRVMIPAILVAVISLAVMIYSFWTMPEQPAGHAPGMPPVDGHRSEGNTGKEIFNTIGNGAILCGAISYLWYLFKKRVASPVPQLKKLTRKLHAVHHYMGYAALAFTILHGVYYLTDIENHHYLTGIAAFLPLVALAVYGWLMKRIRHPMMRKLHLQLSNVWLVTLLIHAGGFFILVTASCILIWVIIRFVDSKNKTIPEGHAI